MARKVFINLPVKNLQRSIDFFTELGFKFNAQFTDATATSMILSEEAYVMLMVEPRFKEFTKKEVGNAGTHSEVINALSADSRAEVDSFADTALASGGSPAMPATDHGFMYGRSFYDPDGHHWEIFYMDPSFVQPQA